jgi:putative hydrolase of the HAD superfamily
MPVGLRIDTLLLDAGGVLVFPNWSRISDTLGRHGLEATAEAIRRADAPAKFALDESYRSGSTDADRGGAYMNMLLDGAGVARSRARDAALEELYAYHAEHNLWEHVPDEVVQTLERLSAAGVKLAVASNANGVLHRALDRVGLARFFHAICDSHVEGLEKPDPRFFRVVLERVNGHPGTALHVGDLYHVDVVGARASGLQALLLDPHDLYNGYPVERLTRLGELVDRLA